jgi:hypothetical protein
VAEQRGFRIGCDGARLAIVLECTVDIANLRERAGAIGQRLWKIGLEPKHMVEIRHRLIEAFQLKAGQAPAVISQGIERLHLDDAFKCRQRLI